MKSTENQRLRDVFSHLKELKIIQYNKDIGDIIGADKFRISYLLKDDGGKLSTNELQTLKKEIPQINWDYVTTGEGDIENSPTMVREQQMFYGEAPERGQVVQEILNRKSTLPESEQLEILREELIIAQQKMLQIYDGFDLFGKLKGLFK